MSANATEKVEAPTCPSRPGPPHHATRVHSTLRDLLRVALGATAATTEMTLSPPLRSSGWEISAAANLATVVEAPPVHRHLPDGATA